MNVLPSTHQFVISDFLTEFYFQYSLCNTDGSQIPNPKSFVSYGEILSYKNWKLLSCSLMWKVTLFFLSTILKYWRDLFSLQMLKDASVFSPTHVLGVSGALGLEFRRNSISWLSILWKSSLELRGHDLVVSVSWCRSVLVPQCRCLGFLVLEPRCRGFLVLRSQCRGIFTSTASFSFSLNLSCHLINVDMLVVN